MSPSREWGCCRAHAEGFFGSIGHRRASSLSATLGLANHAADSESAEVGDIKKAPMADVLPEAAQEPSD